MARRKIMFGVGAGVLSTAVDGLAGLLNIHFLFRYLPDTASGFWLVVVTVGGLFILSQACLSASVSRHVARSAAVGTITRHEDSIIRRLTGRLMTVVMLAGLAVYLGYLRPVADKSLLGANASVGWLAYCVGLVFGLYASSRFAVLNGLGEVGWDKVSRIAASSGGAALTWLSLRHGWGLSGLGFIFLIQNIAISLMARLLLDRHKAIANAAPARSKPWRLKLGWDRSMPTATDLSTGRLLGIETSKLLGLALVAYLTMNSGIFIIESRFGPAMVSKYAPLIRVATLLVTLATLIPQTLYPFVAKAWVTRDFPLHRQLYLAGIALTVGGYGLAALACWFLSPILIPHWLKPGGFLGQQIMGLVLLVYAMPTINSAFANPVLASTGRAFFGLSILNLVCVLSLLWPFTSRWGLAGAPLAMFVGSLPSSVWLGSWSWRLMLNEKHKPKSELSSL